MTPSEFKEKITEELKTNGVTLLDIWTSRNLFCVQSSRDQGRPFVYAFNLTNQILQEETGFVIDWIVSKILKNNYPDNVIGEIGEIKRDSKEESVQERRTRKRVRRIPRDRGTEKASSTEECSP